MSTRSNIGMQNSDGSITAIYVHWDGYPDHHVPILTEHYAAEDKVRALLALGSLSSLAEEVGERHDFDDHSEKFNSQCRAYGRDRGEDGTESRTFPSEAEFNSYASNDYAYLFKSGQWFARERGGAWALASLMLEASEA